MKKQVVYKNHKGGVSRLVPHAANRLEGESDEDLCSRIAKQKVPRDFPWIIMDNPLPLDDDFRAVWKWSGGKQPKLTIDLNEAKEFWINKWRTAREPLLKNLDVEYLRAVEKKDEKLQEEIALKKQQLRDVTEHDLSSVSEVAELKKVWPSSLAGYHVI